MELPFLSDKVGDSVAFSKDALLGLWSMAGEVCAFFAVFPLAFGDGLEEELFTSRYDPPGSDDSCNGEVTKLFVSIDSGIKLRGRESRFE